MDLVFYIAAAVALVSTAMVITRANVAHGLLYLVLSLLAVAVVFFTLGAPFLAALEVIVYAGAIMVLFVFVIMMLNLGALAHRLEKQWLAPKVWVGPSLLALILVAEMVYILARQNLSAPPADAIEPREVGKALFGPYLLCAELTALLLLAALVGVFHLARREDKAESPAESPSAPSEKSSGGAA